MRATRANDKSDNFIDKAFTVMTDIVVAAMPLAQQEKDAYQFYRASKGSAALAVGPWFWMLHKHQTHSKAI